MSDEHQSRDNRTGRNRKTTATNRDRNQTMSRSDQYRDRENTGSGSGSTSSDNSGRSNPDTAILRSTQIAERQNTNVEAQIASVPVEEDVPISPIGKLIKQFVTSGRSRLNVSSQLLPGEELLASKFVIYFDEFQILIGILIVISSFLSYFSFDLGFGIAIILFLTGLSLAATGFASEDLYITNSRVLVRRMTWVDKMFRIPKDSQFILNEIVSFDVQRAPMNAALFYIGLLPLILLLWEQVRQSTISIIIIIGVTLLLILISQRLGKRTLSFSMSGGHQVFLGVYKGIPNSVIEAFIEIIMEKNIFETDSY